MTKATEDDDHIAASETTPLLAASSAGPTLQANEEGTLKVGTDDHAAPAAPEANGQSPEIRRPEDEDKPLPALQLFVVCYARLVEPVAYFCIFPFVPQMIRDTGNMSEKDVGFYSGLIESLFSLTQMLLMISWGRAADRFGRRPVLVFSLYGCSAAVTLFGFSKTIWQMILFRCIAGLFAGTVVTLRAMTSDMSTPKTQARAFSFFAFAGNLGLFIGPFLGGGLSEPAKQYPKVFGGVKLWEQYPYALPTIASGALGLSAAILTTVFAKETLVKKGKSKDSNKDPTVSTWQIIKSPGVGIVLWIYGHIIFLGLAYTAVVTVFWFEPVKYGGFGFSPQMMSIFLALGGASQSLWLLIVFPPLQHRIGTGGVMRLCQSYWPFMFLIMPGLNELRRHGIDTAFWIIAFIMQPLGASAAMSFTAAQLALNDIAPSPTTVGTLNALALTLISGIRAVIPAVFSSIYAAGVKYQILRGHLIWLILFIAAAGCRLAVHWLPKKAEGKLKKNDDQQV
ncbi:MAG: hypothetical protein M1820_004935 [Bogoriella megaspora]|nr:MAG: hypothetical protein M1820_004935 [Bogoriella megaspora]